MDSSMAISTTSNATTGVRGGTSSTNGTSSTVEPGRGSDTGTVWPTVVLERGAGQLPLYQQLIDALAWQIDTGGLEQGTRLPSERDLAQHLGVSRTTVVSAYRELEARGMLRGHVGRGTFVCAPLRSGSATGAGNGTGNGNGAGTESAPFAWRGKVSQAAQRTSDGMLRAIVRQSVDADLIAFAAGAPALDAFPIDLIRDGINRALLREGQRAFDHSSVEGHPRLRRAIAARHGLRPERVQIINGAQQGLDLIARCLLDPGDWVVMDRPGYLGAIQTFRAAGVNISGWDIARADLEELEDLFLRHRPKLLYTCPTFSNPTGRTLSASERHALLDLATRYRVPIIEDDPYRELSFTGVVPATLREIDTQGLVIQLNTFSKEIGPGLRLGWLTATEAIVEQLTLIRQRVDVSSPPLLQLAVADLLTTSAFDQHMLALRSEHLRRHDAMIAALRREFPPGMLTASPVQGGVFLWARLHGLGITARELLTETTARGVVFVPGDAFYSDSASGAGPGRFELRLAFATQPQERIVQGVRRISEALRALHMHTHHTSAQHTLDGTLPIA